MLLVNLGNIHIVIIRAGGRGWGASLPGLPPALVSTPSQLGQDSVGLEEKSAVSDDCPLEQPKRLDYISSSDFPNCQQLCLSFPPLALGVIFLRFQESPSTVPLYVTF